MEPKWDIEYLTNSFSMGVSSQETTERHQMRTMRMALVSLTMVLFSCGGGFSSSSNSETSPPTTIAAITVEALAVAKTNFQQTLDSLGALPGQAINGGVGVSRGIIFGVSANSDKGIISIWEWDGKQFDFGSALTLMDDWCGNACTWGIDKIQTVDLTNDGDDDIFVDYYLNDHAGQVFSQVFGSWKSLEFDLGTHSSKVVEKNIFAYHEPCLPSCAEGIAIPISYVWNGTEFASHEKDDFGNRFTLLDSPACAAYVQSDFEPYKLCDKGNGIRYLQQVLNDSGLLYSSSIKPVDGYFGPATEYSVKVYQYANHLKVDGIVGGQWYHDLIENYNLANGLGG